MDGGSSEGNEVRFAAYVEALGAALGHADRQQPMHDYCLGLLMPIERKSVEPMGGGDRAGAGRREASISASFCWERIVVGHRDPTEGWKVSMHAADDFEIIRIRMKAIARDEGKPPIEVSSSAEKLTQPGCPPHDIGLSGKCASCGIIPPPPLHDYCCN
jgi:hypothetical protein